MTERNNSSTLNWHFSLENTAKVETWLTAFWPAVLKTSDYFVKQDTAARVAICGGLVLKEYNQTSSAKGWLSGVFRSRAKRAYAIGRLLKNAGLPVLDTLAFAAIRTTGSIQHEYLLSTEVPNALNLVQWLYTPNLTKPALHVMLDQLGSLLANFHQAGFFNRDMKGGNILVRESNGTPTLSVVDLDGIRRMRIATSRRISRDFWPLLHTLALNGWDTTENRERLVNAYNTVSSHKINVTAFAKPIRRADPAMSSWTRTEQIIRISGFSKRTLRISFPTANPEWESRALRYWQGGLVHLKSIPASPEAEVKMGAIDSGTINYYFKTFLMRDRFDGFKHLVRCSRASRTREGNATAARQGLGVPRTVCLIEVREHGHTRGSAIITEEIQDATPLRELLAISDNQQAISATERRELARQLGNEVAHWHANKVVHGDMRHGNILCRKKDANWEFIFVDNERTSATTDLHERARNLVQLNMMNLDAIPLSDRLVFWKSYRHSLPESRQYSRQLRSEVITWTRKRWAKKGWL
jgi:tRNA A-37 threonylcarbamoyl transferase component Bud32